MERKNFVWMVVGIWIVCCMIGGTAFAAEDMKEKAVNINTATAEELVKHIPTLTPEMAKNIVEYRKQNGAFQLKEEILQVPGMNRTLLRKLEKYFILDDKGGNVKSC
jgi:competence ComEA-like helix-hairpin-helix protein